MELRKRWLSLNGFNYKRNRTSRKSGIQSWVREDGEEES